MTAEYAGALFLLLAYFGGAFAVAVGAYAAMPSTREDAMFGVIGFAWPILLFAGVVGVLFVLPLFKAAEWVGSRLVAGTKGRHA